MRKLTHNSTTWKLFTELFLTLDKSKYPYNFDINLTRGGAINLAMGLNTAQCQWQQEQGIPSGVLELSAKAKLHPLGMVKPSGEPVWIVEISTSPKRVGRKTKGTFALQEALRQLQESPDRQSEPVQLTGYVDKSAPIFENLLNQRSETMKNFSTEVNAGNIEDNRPTIPGFDERPSSPRPDRLKPLEQKTYTRKDLEDQGWTFDEHGNAKPPEKIKPARK